MSFLFWGFTAMWVVIVAYVWSLATRQRKLAEDVETVSDVLARERSQKTE